MEPTDLHAEIAKRIAKCEERLKELPPVNNPDHLRELYTATGLILLDYLDLIYYIFQIGPINYEPPP